MVKDLQHNISTRLPNSKIKALLESEDFERTHRIAIEPEINLKQEQTEHIEREINKNIRKNSVYN